MSSPPDALAPLWSAGLSHLDELAVGAVAADREGRLVYCNSSAQSLLGHPRGVLSGTPLTQALTPTNHHGALEEIATQVLAGGRWVGELPLHRFDGEVLQGVAVSVTPLRDEEEVLGLLMMLEDPSTADAARTRVHRLGERLARLARVTAELVSAQSSEAVTDIVVSQAAEAVGATVATMMRLEDPDTLALVGIRGGADGAAERWATIPVDDATPAGECVLTRKPVVVSGHQVIASRYPALPGLTDTERSLVCLPLVVGGRVLGAISLSIPGRRTFDTAELEFLSLLADTSAQALERIQALEVAAQQAAKLRFLADASAQLAGSLDYQDTLRHVAWLGVPELADWCVISLLEDGELRTLELAHADPDKLELVRRLQERFPSPRDAPRGPWSVIRSGRSELVPTITDEMLVASARDEEHLRLARELNLRSYVVAPLVARGRALGAITWVSADDGRRYTTEDLAFVEDLAQRAAVAIDNAQLHSQTLESAVRLQRAVLPERLGPEPGWDLAAHYSPAGRTGVGGDFYDVVPLAEGKMALFVGDVMGRGVSAAAAMAQMRASVRSYIATDPRPECVVGNLDAMFTMFDFSQLVTLVYALADPARNEVSVAIAGHPPPVMLHPEDSIEALSEVVGAPLGAEPGPRRAFCATMAPGDTLLLFTDGLIERRSEDIDAGQGRLATAAPLLHGSTLGSGLDLLVNLVRDHTREDDVAALAARRRPVTDP